MRQGRINFIGLLLTIAVVVGGIGLWRFGPYWWDHQVMNEIVQSSARAFQDRGEDYGKGRMLQEMKDRDLPTYLTVEMCDFGERGNLKTVTCEWRVDVAWPIIGRVERLHFVSAATINASGFLE